MGGDLPGDSASHPPNRLGMMGLSALDSEAEDIGGAGALPQGVSQPTAISLVGVVVGMPCFWLRLEGAALAAGCLIAYSTTGQPWWLVPVTILLPDVLALGYAVGPRIGARLYNLSHVTAFPALVIGLGWWQGNALIAALGLIWLAHIGFDRLMGFGLKYDDSFQHTHLSEGRRASAGGRTKS
jgi:hypothetical protein